MVSLILGVLVLMTLVLFGWSLSRIYRRTGHSVLASYASFYSPFILLIVFIGLEFFGVQLSEAISMLGVFALLIVWLGLITFLALKTWPIDNQLLQLEERFK